jgi:hypothetical protein
MKLPHEVSITVPDKTNPIKISELPVVLIDVEKNKKVLAQMVPFYKTLTLWENEGYDAIGDYTQSQAESRILELLGEDIAKSLLSLYVSIPAKKPK